MDLKQLQQKIADDWSNQSSHQPDLSQQILYIIEEFGEVAEAIRKQNGLKTRKATQTDIGSEFADLVISILTLANTMEVDVDDEVKKFWLRLEARRQD